MDEIMKATQMFQQMQTVLGVMNGQNQMQQQPGGMYNNNPYQRNGGQGWRPYNRDGGDSYSRGGRRSEWQRNWQADGNGSKPPGLHDKVDSLTKVVESLTSVVQGNHTNTHMPGVAPPPQLSNQMVSMPPPPPHAQQQMVQQQVQPKDLDTLGSMIVDGLKVEMTRMSDEFTNHIMEIKHTMLDYEKVQTTAKKDINALTLDVTRLTTELADIKRSLSGTKWAAQLLKGEVHGMAKRVLEHDRHLAGRAQLDMYKRLKKSDSPNGPQRPRVLVDFSDDEGEEPSPSDGPDDETPAINKVLSELSDGDADTPATTAGKSSTAPAPSPAILPSKEGRRGRQTGKEGR